MRYRVLPYKQGSKSAKALAEALGGKVLKIKDSKYKPRNSDVVVNWGSINRPDGLDTAQAYLCVDLINDFNDIRKASNKKLFFELLKDTGLTPNHYLKKEDIPDDQYPIVCRTIVSGHSGDGIVIANDAGSLVDAPLYVSYIKKKDEYRVHLGKKYEFVGQNDHDDVTHQYVTKVIAIQRKARSLSNDTPNWLVRTHANGFNFVRENVNPPASVVEAAIQAFNLTSLDFGAVDVIYNQHKEKAYVLEINTAPGLEGQTIQDYADYFKSVV